MIAVDDFDIGGFLDIAGLHFARTALAQNHAARTFTMHAQRNLFQVEHDVGDVFTHAGNGRELVQHAVDLHCGDGRALKRGQQHTAQRIAKRHAETTLERLGHDLGVARSVMASPERRASSDG